MKWTTEHPIEAGWYWMDNGMYKEVVQVIVRPGHSYLCIQVDPGPNSRREFRTVKRLKAKWAGPIPEPTE